MDCSMPDCPILHCLPELAQIHVHWVDDAIQPSHPLLFPCPPAFSFSQHQGLLKWVNSSHQVAKILELQHQSFQWIFRTYFHGVLMLAVGWSASVFPSSRVFFNESALPIRWPKYWSFSISPPNEYSGLISFRIDWSDLLAMQGTLKSLLQHRSVKASIL